MNHNGNGEAHKFRASRIPTATLPRLQAIIIIIIIIIIILILLITLGSIYPEG